MPRNNLFLLIVVAILSAVCYQKADSANRSDHAQVVETYYKAMQAIEKEYVQKVDRRQLLEGSLRGMVGELDEHSAYFNPEQYRHLTESLDQRFGGIGIHLSVDDETKQLVVTTPLVGTPAYKAGVLAGDKLVKIDDKSTDGFTMEDAVKLLRGAPGQAVTLTVVHPGTDTPVAIPLEREMIQVPTVLGDTYNEDDTWNFFLSGSDHIGLLRVTQFGEKTTREMQKALAWLRERNVRGLIIDLRNNPGGLLEESVSVCDLFVKEGRIVSTRGREADSNVHISDASGNAPYTDFPIAILVNSSSASASEIVAACLQDHSRAVVVGDRTFGKGSVQNLIPLEGGKSAIKLTTASYWRPSGKKIHRLKNAKDEDEWGVTPDEGYLVKVDRDEARKVMNDRIRRDVVRPAANAPKVEPVPDRQMEKALEYLKEQLESPAIKTKAA